MAASLPSSSPPLPPSLPSTLDSLARGNMDRLWKENRRRRGGGQQRQELKEGVPLIQVHPLWEVQSVLYYVFSVVSNKYTRRGEGTLPL